MTFEEWWDREQTNIAIGTPSPHAAAKAAWIAAQSDVSRGWIDVTTRLPELHLYPKDPKDPEDFDWWRSWSVFCAVTEPDGKRQVRKGMLYRTQDGDRWETDYGQWDAEGTVTHWQERPEWPTLPEAPQSNSAR